MFNRILVVCVGNICRSPMGEALLKQMLPNKQISSAGLATEASGLTGQPADVTANEVAASHGVELNSHHAQQLTAQLCQEYDLILVMEPEHINAVAKLSPDARHKTLLFGQWREGSISDPYLQGQEAFTHSFKAIHSAAKAWASRLS
ncbi:low molecular weight phosphotyrosine protein phosphatase [Photobacterium sp. BZF1]|uniref:arsenate reductase/protein-tyrosine-phosphatase family protein n=1 Tax=Photobacterium sp. BZF1 TaxID=1904457 RepID=UPI0016539D70|nr:low molecular weight phosphotyrosine protein phosphatase [Photobacterium sp. BZF1]MBC7005671.1 low molecular weight phosphotyrosine protein phosphatase [Photobacterium sp. BZF1]